MAGVLSHSADKLNPKGDLVGEPVDIESSMALTVRRFLENGGVPAQKAAEFVALLSKVADEENVDHLVPWLSDADDRLSLIAASSMIAIDRTTGEKRIFALVKSAKSPRDTLVLALGMTERKDIIDFLVRRISGAAGTAKDSVKAALQVRTGRTFTESSQWKTWWKKERDSFKHAPISDPAEFFQRLNMLKIGTVIRDLAASNSDSMVRDAFSAVADVFNSLAEGQAMEFSEETLQGVAHFCRGELEEALDAYAAALRIDQFDRVALLDSACLLLETSRFEEAADTLRRLEALIPNSWYVARLRKLAESKVPHDRWLPFLKDAIQAKEDKLNVSSDPFVRFFLSRSTSAAKLAIPPDALNEILADPEAPFRAQLGAALVSPKPISVTSLGLLRTRFPDSAIAQACSFFVTFGQRQWAKENAEACQRWSELEPTNAVPQLGLLTMKVEKSAKAEGHPLLRGALLDELDQVLTAADFNLHLEEVSSAIDDVVRRTEFPLPGLVLQADGLLSSYLLELGSGVLVSEKELRAHGKSVEEIARLTRVVGALAERFPARSFRAPMTRIAATIIMINALNLQKGTLEANGGDQAAVDAIAERKKALDSEMHMNGTRPPEILTIIPLPSLHRALGDYDLEQ
jgi:tetratricopeptide (TPR) repeat protein